MILKQTIINLISEQTYRGNTRTQPLIDAIKKRNTVTFYYSGPIKPKKDSVKRGTRYKAEVMALGLTKKGYMAIRAYVQPPSTSKKGFKKHGWRTFLVTRMSNIQINTDEVFDTKRPGYKEGDDSSFSVTYAKTDWGVKSNPKPIKKPTPQPKTEPTAEPETKVEPQKTELPQPKPVEKPQDEPTPQAEKPEPEELPQPKPDEGPSEDPETPEEDEDENLMENIKRIKGLMLLLN
jgi:hypothetical protein